MQRRVLASLKNYKEKKRYFFREINISKQSFVMIVKIYSSDEVWTLNIVRAG